MEREEKIKQCQHCTEYCSQRELADRCAKGRMYATNEVIRLQNQLEEYGQLKDQGRLLILPCEVGDVIDKLFSHNEIVALWIEKKKEISYHEVVWNGMAWDIPEVLKKSRFVKIFGTIPMAISEADHINIEVILDEEAEAALEKMKGE